MQVLYGLSQYTYNEKHIHVGFWSNNYSAHGIFKSVTEPKATNGWEDGQNNRVCVGVSGFGGLEVACWPGSNPAEAVGFFRAKQSSARLPSEGK